jgi:sortase A
MPEMPANVSSRNWLRAERTAWASAAIALTIWGAANIAGKAGASQDLERFEAIRDGRVPQPALLPETQPPDLSQWEQTRIRAWRTAMTQTAPRPLGILRVPKIRLEVAVLPGTSDFVLNRAVGHIEGTVLPGADGNAGIAGHRDGFFRGLKDIRTGDAIELETIEGRQTYHVARTWVVRPEEVSVLAPTPVRALTLVTCYPFYFIGDAPQRFIVRATESAVAQTGGAPSGPGNSFVPGRSQ